MFKALFLATLLLTLLVNIFFLFASKDKPPDLRTSTYVSIGQFVEEPTAGLASSTSGQRRLFLRSNDFYDYSQQFDSPEGNATSEFKFEKKLKSENVELQQPLENKSHLSDNQSSSFDGHDDEEAKRIKRPDDKGLSKRSGQLLRGRRLRVGNYNLQFANAELDLLVATGKPQNGDYQIGATSQPSSRFNPTSRFLNITVKSSKNHVFISVDNNVIYSSGKRTTLLTGDTATTSSTFDLQKRPLPLPVAEPPEPEGRGIHVLVLNQFDGYIMSKRLFDTYSPQQDEELCLYINMIRDGRIIIFAVRDEASFKMPPQSRARKLLKQLGSVHIGKLAWRDMWAMVVRKSTTLDSSIQLGESRRVHLEEASRGQNLAEALSKSSRFSDWGPPLLIQAQVELLPASEEKECQWLEEESEEARKRRRNFCNRVEGYGQVCDCRQPAAIAFKPEPIQNSQLNQVPIVVMASNRPYYLYRMLRSLLQAKGVNVSLITVFVDGFYEEPAMVSRLFNLRVVHRKPLGKRSARISHHYKSSLTETFELFPRAQFAIIFEEDLDVASDALVYFNQTIELLKEDPTLYCASAWNDQGYEHSVGRQPNLMYRIETMPGLGWMLSRELFKAELEPKWPSYELQHDWDMWIRTQKVRKNRECLIPDISRTFHFGSIGTNINSFFQRQYFSKHAFAGSSSGLTTSNSFNVSQLNAEAYERLIEQLLKDGHVLRKPNDDLRFNDTQYLCSLSVDNNNYISDQHQPDEALHLIKQSELDTGKAAKNNVIFIDMIDGEDFANWLKLAKCWHLWDLDARGQHNSMWRLFLNDTPTMVVGVPASPYSQFKPANLKPFNLSN